jgi:CspA family cold shock protein
MRIGPIGSRLGVLADCCYTRPADVEFCDGLRCQDPAIPASAAAADPDDDFLSIDDPTHDRPLHFRFGAHQVLERNTIMPIGTVKFFNTDKGYGFISPEDGGADSFVHITAVQAAGMQTLNKDQRLSYEVERGRNGKESAVNLQQA